MLSSPAVRHVENVRICDRIVAQYCDKTNRAIGGWYLNSDPELR